MIEALIRRRIAALLRPIGRPLLQRVYQHALKSEDPLKRNQGLGRALWLRRYLYPQGGRVMGVAELDEGLRLWANLCEMEGGNLYFGVEFEPDELAMVKKLVKSGSVFFDVGAHIGVYSLIASRLVGSEGAVHAFEPALSTYEVLLKNISLNRVSNVVVNQIAVSEQTGEAELFLNLETGLNSLGQTGRGNPAGTEKVESISLDEYVARHKISPVNFLKVDVEGYEGHVLRGAQRLIEQEHDLTILCELAEKNFRPLNLSVNEVMDWMRERGYEVWEIDRPHSSLVRLETSRTSYQNNNFVFVRPGAAGQLTISEISQDMAGTANPRVTG